MATGKRTLAVVGDVTGDWRLVHLGDTITPAAPARARSCRAGAFAGGCHVLEPEAWSHALARSGDRRANDEVLGDLVERIP